MFPICIIDDGVNENYFQIGNLEFNFEIDKDLAMTERSQYNPSRLSHGSACAAIIKSYVPDALIGSIKILDDKTKQGFKGQLLKAMEWCIENKIKIINLSLGSVNSPDLPEILKTVNRAYRAGVFIIAAQNNYGLITYPASLTHVIGVKCDKTKNLNPGEYTFILNPIDGIEICASGKHKFDKNNGKFLDINSRSNSFAAPLISAKVYGLLKSNPSLNYEELKKILKSFAYNNHAFDYNPYRCSKVDWIEKAIYIPLIENNEALNKEPPCTFDITETLPYNYKDENNFKNLIKELANRKNSALAIDAVLLEDLSDTLSKKAEKLYELIDNLNRMNLNFLYINKKSKKELNIPSELKVNHWLSNNNLPFNYDKIPLPDIQIPLILIFNRNEHDLIVLLKTFEKLFKNDGYSPCVITDSMSGVLSGIEINNAADPEGIINTVKILNTISNPDLIIYGIHDPDNFLPKFNSLQDALGIDILISINDDEKLNAVLPANHKIKLIFISNKDENGAKHLQREAGIFMYKDPDTNQDVYRYIRTLFAGNG